MRSFWHQVGTKLGPKVVFRGSEIDAKKRLKTKLRARLGKPRAGWEMSGNDPVVPLKVYRPADKQT